MRIQHNIAALNSYRNLTNNNSAVAKNLEKLSSGYRINRAGDDAAGLAISEKMRAQITGLQTAQKNANDGISLVQTAEGALTEVHSMLNRMVELANQSANGTYADEVDRENLQAEIESLRSEINRISESTNFNGINLLDGSMNAEAVKTDGSFTVAGTGVGALPAVGATLETNTVLHQTKADAVAKTTFSVDLHNVKFSNETGRNLELKIGDTTYTLEGGGAAELDAAKISKALADGNFKDADGNAVAANAFKFGDGTFTASASGTRITFTQNDGDTGTVDGDMKVNVKGVVAADAGDAQKVPAVKAKYSFDLSNATDADGATTLGGKKIDGQEITWDATGVTKTMNDFVAAYNAVDTNKYTASYDTTSKKLTLEAKVGGAVATDPITDIALKEPAVKAVYTAEVTATSGYLDNETITVGGESINVKDDGTGDITSTDANDPEKLAAAIATKLNAAAGSQYVVTAAGSTITWTAKVAGAVDAAATGGIPTAAPTISATGGSGTATFGTVTEATEGKDQAATATTVTAVEEVAGADETAAGDATGVVTGDWNASTTVIENKTSGSDERLASTSFTLTKEMASDGGYVRFGDTKYEFTTDAAKKGTANMVYIGDLVDDNGVLKDNDALDTAADRLTKAAAQNDVYTVGNQHGNFKITVTENPGYTTGSQKYDLTKKEGIEASLGFGTATKSANGKALTLQIGDTSEDFNQLTLSIESTSADALGIGSIDIGTQEGAAAAVDKIKAAINKVSSTRGDLGAVQNRLEHTINNLSVTTENITAAESRIRDVDMAEEMMAYTKNNILVQAAQAMLAQANQVPQGVLQLLQ